MTFIPLLGYYLLRPGKPEPPIEERRSKGFTGFYASTAKFAIEHRWKVAIGSLAFLVLGAFLFSQLKTSFLPLTTCSTGLILTSGCPTTRQLRLDQ